MISFQRRGEAAASVALEKMVAVERLQINGDIFEMMATRATVRTHSLHDPCRIQEARGWKADVDEVVDGHCRGCCVAASSCGQPHFK